MQNNSNECLLCKTKNARTVSVIDRKGKPLKTCICEGCGLVFNQPIPTDDELAKFYSQDYRKEYKGSFRPRGRQIIRNFRRVSNHISCFSDIFANAKNILDVGAGSGEFVFAMSYMGKNACGIEPNKEYAEYCRSQLHIDISTLAILDATFPKDSFDFINISHVVEHLNDPVRYLSMLSQWLQEDGILYVDVPNIYSYTKMKSKGNMFHYGHIFNFSPWTLRSVCALAGFVECANTAERCAESTGVFFEKTNKTFITKDALNRENAESIGRAIDEHNQYDSVAVKRFKFINKIWARIEETISSRRLGTPSKIGESVLGHLK